jgi:hypothetical protein
VESRIKQGGVHVGTVYRRCRYDEMRAEVRFDNLAGCLRTPQGGNTRHIVMVIAGRKVRFRWMSPREDAPTAPDTRKKTQGVVSATGKGRCIITDHGATSEEIEQAVLPAITAVGFPRTVAAWQ